jgi:single-strand DNA-binding protein
MRGTSITVIGNLVTPVNRRNLSGGRSVARFRVACNERRIDRTTGEWGDGDTFYIGVTCWRELAEHVGALFGIGDPIIVQGRIRTSEFETKDGRRSVQEIDADAVGPDLARCRVSNLTRTRRGDPPVRPVERAADAGPLAAAVFGEPVDDVLDPFDEPVEVPDSVEVGPVDERGAVAPAVPGGGR